MLFFPTSLLLAVPGNTHTHTHTAVAAAVFGRTSCYDVRSNATPLTPSLELFKYSHCLSVSRGPGKSHLPTFKNLLTWKRLLLCAYQLHSNEP